MLPPWCTHLQIIENQAGLWDPPLEFFTSVYYVVVSFCTVGYGDIAPRSTAGRVMVIFMLAWSFVMVRTSHCCWSAPNRSGDVLLCR